MKKIKKKINIEKECLELVDLGINLIELSLVPCIFLKFLLKGKENGKSSI